MSRFLKYEPCPRCRSNGSDRAGDNLGVYADGSAHCFSCGFHKFPKHFVREVKEDAHADKAVLPRDFTREVPAAGWKWLLQWGLPYSYWKPFTGYSPAEERLILTFGNPVRFSIGRYIGRDRGEDLGASHRKWKLYGNRHGYVEILGDKDAGKGQAVVLVEDLISAHKVAQVTPSLCLFGTNIHDLAVKALIASKRPVIVWLDADQRGLLAAKINRLQTFLRHPVRHVVTEKDPKAYSLDEIRTILAS